MIATMNIQAHEISPPSEHRFIQRNLNATNAPLPLIPRRTPSTSSTRPIVPVKLAVQPSTPPEGQSSISLPISDSDSSSSPNLSDGTASVRVKRVRGVRSSSVCPPEQSTPTPAVHNARMDLGNRQLQSHCGKGDDSTPRPMTRSLIYTPGVPLRLQTSRNVPETHTRASTEPSTSVIGISSSQPGLIRKKSGQLVKPSLKILKPGDSLSVVPRGIPSKSEPNTPTHSKFVHFDTKLEHVKLFLAEQKPLAVSRDGSPTEDTSGTDSDFPSFIFGDVDEKPRKSLVMRVPNMPQRIDLNADVALESLILSPDTKCILGRVRVRNIAYAKWLAVRFTFDSWQTTSEVTAKYVESISSDFDRFSFKIRLNDLLARIEEKTLYLALRYTVAGMELWDNNGGRNYFAEFTKSGPTIKKVKASNDKGSTGSDIADLKSKLEKVAQGQEKAGPSFLTQKNGRENGLGMSSLASRYDFGTSLREPWKPGDFTPLPRHTRTQSYPVTIVSTPNSIPWPSEKLRNNRPTIQTTPLLGSPRDIDDDMVFSKIQITTNLEDTPTTVVGSRPRHHRRAYFDDNDINQDSSLKKTPPGTPTDDSTPLPTRFHPFPLTEGTGPAPPHGLGLIPDSAYTDSSEGSELPTPPLFSDSPDSYETTSSLADSFRIDSIPGRNDNEEQASPNTNYRQFLNQFCFFTGPGSMGSMRSTPLAQPEFIPRAHSASDVDQLTIISTSPPIYESAAHMLTTLTQSLSTTDAVGTRSGSSTPTVPVSSSPSIISNSQTATPIVA